MVCPDDIIRRRASGRSWISVVVSHFSFVRRSMWQALLDEFPGVIDTVLDSVLRAKGPTTAATMVRNPTAYDQDSLEMDSYCIEIPAIRFPSG